MVIHGLVLLFLASPTAELETRESGPRPRAPAALMDEAGVIPPERAVAAHPEEGLPTAPLDEPHASRWLAGRELFARDFARGDGLGPGFNATSCAACHAGPTTGGAGGLEHNVGGVDSDGRETLGYWGSGPPPPREVAALRVHVSRMEPEARELFLTGLTPVERALADGPLAVGLQTPSLFGLGWFDTVHETEILSREDPDDRDGDGVRGVASRVDVGGRTEVGRFGWFAQAPTMADFVRGACGGELGLTVPADTRGFGREQDRDEVADPELAFHELQDLVFYCSDLAPPPRGGRAADAEVGRGAAVFERIGCATCHVPRLEGRFGPVEAYTDLLLHHVDVPPAAELPQVDVTADAAGVAAPPVEHVGTAVERRVAPRGRRRAAPERVAFRTPPLWGISRTGPYLHHGGAETLEQAIVAHGGEALRARMDWRRLDAEDRAALLAFLEDL